MHWLMNVITGEEGHPQGVLFRAGGMPLDDSGVKKKLDGPAKLTKYLGINKTHNGMTIYDNPDVWLEDDGETFEIKTDVRVGIDYATEEYRNKQWRFLKP
jgi:DNA-3-methyladenine glycosylase